MDGESRAQEALGVAWSAITTTAIATTAITTSAQADQMAGFGRSTFSTAEVSTVGPAHLRRALEAAVRGGRDTDTVAAIAGALVGGLYGASAAPAEWRRHLHGWPGLRARDLNALGVMIARGSGTDVVGWPADVRMDYSKYRGRAALARHPYDEDVWLGGVDALRQLPAGVDAVVSLCRLGAAEVPAPGVAAGDHVEYWLLDDPDPAKNSNLDFVLGDAAATVAAMRAEGRTVLLHCVQAQSRTPTVAALYGARLTGRTPIEALADIAALLPDARPNPAFRAALQRLG